VRQGGGTHYEPQKPQQGVLDAGSISWRLRVLDAKGGGYADVVVVVMAMLLQAAM
jgi:hypothetical protein